MKRLLRRKRGHALAWVVTLLLLSIGAHHLFSGVRWQARAGARAPAPPGSADWFLLVQMPEVSAQYESGIDTMRVRMGEWLAAMRDAGFKPIRLSEALARLERGEGLPERSVAIVFRPGYRRTYEIAGPIFRKYKVPVTWLSSRKGMGVGDRRHVTYHDLRRMRLDHGWDAGSGDLHGFARLQDPRSGLSRSRRRQGRWSWRPGALALNRGAAGRLEYLLIDATWTASELISRLQAELPAGPRATLGIAQIHELPWGVALPAGQAGEGFELAVKPHLREVTAYWLGTAGLQDLSLRLSVREVVGEIHLLLRTVEVHGDGIAIKLAGRQVVVEEIGGGERRQLKTLAQEATFSRRPYVVEVVLAGQELSIIVNGRPAVTVQVAPPARRPGMVQLRLTNSARGTAAARGVRLELSRWPQELAGKSRQGSGTEPTR